MDSDNYHLFYIISIIFPTLLTLLELLGSGGNKRPFTIPLSWLLIAIAWIVVVAIIFVLNTNNKISKIDKLEKEIEYMKKEIDLNNKVIKFYEVIYKNDIKK